MILHNQFLQTNVRISLGHIFSQFFLFEQDGIFAVFGWEKRFSSLKQRLSDRSVYCFPENGNKRSFGCESMQQLFLPMWQHD